MRLPILVFAFCFAAPALAQESGGEWIRMAAQDVARSQITLPGSKPFHIKARIVEVESPASDFRAAIEEYWVAPTKWRRTIENPDFSQTLIINGDKVLETDHGDYYPSWLSNLVTAIFDPLPLSLPKNAGSRSAATINPRITSICTGAQVSNDTWNFCFNPLLNVITSVVSSQTGYGAEFRDFKEFEKKEVPREIDSYPAPGFRLQATITQLEPLREPDEQMFAIENPTPPQGRITTIQVTEETLRSLVLSDTKIDWPPVAVGPVTGGCAVHISVDRAGHVREAWPGGCDNAGLEDGLDDVVRTWQLKQAVSNGVPVQLQARLTFSFATTLTARPMPVLSDADARAHATSTMEPTFPPGSGESGSEISIRVTVDERGRFASCDNTHNLAPAVFQAADQAVQHWHFKPYVQDGEPRAFYAEIIFRIP